MTILEDETSYTSVRGSFVDGQAWLDGIIPTALPNNITGITKANPGVVSSTAHGLEVGDLVYFDTLTEMTELNWQVRAVTVKDSADAFSISTTAAYVAAETTGGACGHSVVSLSTQFAGTGYRVVLDAGDGSKAIGYAGPEATIETLGTNLFDQDGGGGSGDKGAFTLADLRLAELSSGTLTVGKMYEISAQSLLDFTADGAPNSTVGTTFIATGTSLTLTAADKVYPVDISWVVYGTNTMEIDSGALKISYVDDASGAKLTLRDAASDFSADLEVGKQYKITGNAKVGATDSVALRLYSGAAPYSFSSVTITSTSFVPFELYLTADSTTACAFRSAEMAAGEEIWLDNLKLYEVTEPNASAVHIYKQRGLVNEGWYSNALTDLNAGTSFDFNVYKEGGGAALW